MPELKRSIRVTVVHICTQTLYFFFFRKKCQMYEEKKKVQIYENKTRKRESVVTRFQVKLEEIQICELLGLISHTNMFGMPFFKHTKPTPCI